MKVKPASKEIPNINDKDLFLLFKYAEKVIKIGKKYGLPTLLSVYSKAYSKLKLKK
jgi:hypothetical protein